MIRIKNYILIIKEEYKFTKKNIPLPEALKKYPETVDTLQPGTIMYSQNDPFTKDQIEEVKTQGFTYSWGFGPCFEMIPMTHLQFAEVKPFDLESLTT